MNDEQLSQRLKLQIGVAQAALDRVSETLLQAGDDQIQNRHWYNGEIKGMFLQLENIKREAMP